MARLRTLKICALNIVTHPHSPETYVSLLRDLDRLEDSVPVRGTKSAIITQIWPRYGQKFSATTPINGMIATFDKIDFNHDWLSLRSKKKATAEEMRSIQVPRGMHPNAQYFLFTFYPQKHIMYVVTNQANDRLSPGNAAKIFQQLCKHPAIVDKYKKIDISVLPDREKLEQIFRMSRLERLSMDFTLPNPDEFERKTKAVYNRLNKMKVGRVSQVIKALDKDGIKPDEELGIYMGIAADNGHVAAKGVDEAGKKTEISTKDHPFKAETRYDPATQTDTLAFEDKADDLYKAHKQART